jgi:hypothetical protein
MYMLSAQGQLKKVNSRGDSAGVFNLTKKYGVPQIDVSNPLKVLLFFKDYSTMLVIDRFMNVINNIDLRRQNIFQLQAVTSSYDNQFWFYDEQAAKLKKMNDQGQVTGTTVDFRQLFDDIPSPQTIIDREGLVYLYDTARGVYVFDYYGALKVHKPLLHWQHVHVFNKTIYGVLGDSLVKQPLLSPLSAAVSLPAALPPFKKMEVIFNRLYFLHENSISIYEAP